ncbi:hypothetical protein ACROYT_G014039 [Oculina patagonica]
MTLVIFGQHIDLLLDNYVLLEFGVFLMALIMSTVGGSYELLQFVWQTAKVWERRLPGLQTSWESPCYAHGVTYKIECQGCKDEYIGETARNAYTRDIEHTEGLENHDEKSALCKHCIEKHEKEWQEFKMSVTGVYGNDAMLRQIAESVKINRVDKGIPHQHKGVELCKTP